ncbi:MAG: hypothetical protein ACOX7R_10945 [Acetivibrionales bacterium]
MKLSFKQDGRTGHVHVPENREQKSENVLVFPRFFDKKPLIEKHLFTGT